MVEAPLLSVNQVSMRFGGLQALSNLSFDVDKGQIKGIIGPNGAGKSTIFNVIAGVLKPQDGTVRFKGKEVQGSPSHKRVGLGMARTFQNLQIFPNLSVIENVMVGCHSRFKAGFCSSLLAMPWQIKEEKAIQEIAYEKLQLLGLLNKAQTLAGNLSFGESKILEIARALAANPDILLLDEPVAGVPHAEVAEVAQVIKAINKQGISVLLVEHNMKFVMDLCDDIVVLNYGQKIAEGTASVVRTDPQVLTAYLGEDYAYA